MKTTKNYLEIILFVCAVSFLLRCTGGTDEKSSNDTLTSAARVAGDTVLADCSTDACGACDNDARYPSPTDGGGMEIAPATGKELVLGFHNDHKDVIKGAFISKVALDSIFCHHKDFNGLNCYIANDGSGNQTIVIEGWRQEENSSSLTRVLFNSALPAEDRYKVFQAQSMCPSACSYCGTD